MWSDTITRRPLPGDAASDAELDAECSCPHCQGAIDDDDDYDHAGADPFGAPPGAAGGGRMPGTDAHGRVHAPRRPDGPHSLRKLYRELATRFHPDKADDEASRAEHERLMREINSAYDARDLDALARLSQELGFEVAGDGLLETLAVQYERLKAEIRALRAGRFGQIVVELRRCARDSEPPPFEVFANDIHARASHLGRLAQVFRGYRSGRLSKASFLAQLFPMSDDDDDDDDDLDLSPDAEAELLEVITALASALAPAMARGAKPQTKRNRNKRRRKRR
jgi:curved DNA-binding protein CbpA